MAVSRWLGMMICVNILSPSINQDHKIFLFERKKRLQLCALEIMCGILLPWSHLSRWWRAPLNLRCRGYYYCKNRAILLYSPTTERMFSQAVWWFRELWHRTTNFLYRYHEVTNISTFINSVPNLKNSRKNTSRNNTRSLNKYLHDRKIV